MASQATWVSARIIADAQQADALGDALMEAGALSVTVEDADAGTPEETPQYGEPGMETQLVWARSVLSALFDADQPVAEIVAECAAALGLQAELTIEDVPETDWVRATQAQFEPIPIAGPLWIVPTWHTPPQADAINLILDPGLAFGTGSHPTTRMCLQWLVRERPNGSVLDYGCGSGILAIAAAKLGASEVVGVDIDPQAVRSAHDNADANSVEAAFFDASQTLPTPYDEIRCGAGQYSGQPIARTGARTHGAIKTRCLTGTGRSAGRASRRTHRHLQPLADAARWRHPGRLEPAGRYAPAITLLATNTDHEKNADLRLARLRQHHGV